MTDTIEAQVDLENVVSETPTVSETETVEPQIEDASVEIPAEAPVEAAHV